MKNNHHAVENPFLEPGPEPACKESAVDSSLGSSPEAWKEKGAEHTKVNLAQVASRQAQLEGMVEETNQAVHTIKQLLERMVIPPVQPTSRLRYVVERPQGKQQVIKATTHGNATSTCSTNSQ